MSTECQISANGQHVWIEEEDGAVICAECDELLLQGKQPHKEDRHHAPKKIPS